MDTPQNHSFFVRFFFVQAMDTEAEVRAWKQYLGIFLMLVWYNGYFN